MSTKNKEKKSTARPAKEMNALKKADSLEQMKSEMEALEERNKKLQEEIVIREELMMNLFSYMEANKLKNS